MIARADLPDLPEQPEPLEPLAHHVRRSLEARIDRLLARPVVATVPRPSRRADHGPDEAASGGNAGIFGALCEGAARHAPRRGVGGEAAVWQTTEADGDDEGCVRVRVDFDYDGANRGREKEIVEELQSVLRDEGEVVLLTGEQARLLREKPRAFVEMEARPEAVQLVGFKNDWHGSAERVVKLDLARGPMNPASIAAIAIVPNLVQLERQLDALDAIERAATDGPLAPLRALVGLEADLPEPADRAAAAFEAMPDERLDEHQHACVRAALDTDHFAVVHGPPGAGKTTVIGSIIRRLVDRGERVLVVSPTHVAIDNVVEKLTDIDGRNDDLHPATLPVRFATRPNRLSEKAQRYWSSRTTQVREYAIEDRVEAVLRRRVEGAGGVFDQLDDGDTTTGPLTAALAEQHSVICGTPIGILSHEGIGDAEPGAFDTLIIDEVSKLTVPEFLAIAVKARRWVLVGDPQQLPPFCDPVECAWTLRDVIDPALELVCSVGAVLERAKPFEREMARLVVVARDPDRVADAIVAHANGAGLDRTPSIGTIDEAPERGIGSGILVCEADEIESALDRFDGDARVLVEIGLECRVAIRDERLVGERDRAGARVFETCFNTYHAQPWEALAEQKLSLVRFRKGLHKYLPSQAAIDELGLGEDRQHLIQAIADRLLANTVSVYDMLLGLPDSEHFDVSPMAELAGRCLRNLCERVQPFTGVLKKQYRMHPSLSRLPRELFYAGQALHDGLPDAGGEAGVRLIQVDRPEDAPHESNPAEVKVITNLLNALAATPCDAEHASIMVLMAYNEQRRLFDCELQSLDLSELPITVESCTLDSCQGKEADYVLLSLVKSHATKFLDNPKRWNVALTRARQGLFIVGDIDAYLKDASRQRAEARRRGEWPSMSLLSRVLADLDAMGGAKR
ncbi:MAG: AAA domain-containing protein [Phycisphaerales bacterium]